MRIMMLFVTFVVLICTITAMELPGQDTEFDPTNIVVTPGPPGQQAPYIPIDPVDFLEPGFPVKGLFQGVSHHAGSAIHTLVGNIDSDPRLEILTTSIGNGPLNAWHHDGTVVNGWPVGLGGVAYPALGRLSNSPFLDIVAGYYWGGAQGDMAAYAGDGIFLPGLWPMKSASIIGNPPGLADVNNDGIFEIFVEEGDHKLHGYDAAGNVLPGWPVHDAGGNPGRHTPAFADLDGDGELEIIAATGPSSGTSLLLAYNPDGSHHWAPVAFNGTYGAFPAIGDVDGDSELEVVIVGQVPDGLWIVDGVIVFSNTGQIERQMALATSLSGGTAPALADLDGDTFPEIIVQSEDALDVFKGDTGQPLAGWPVVFGPSTFACNSSPVVGDVDGDQKPEIVIATDINLGQLRIYERNGTLNKKMGITELPLFMGAVPAIADIDLDGRNEVIVTGTVAITGYQDLVWAFDLGGPKHGPILWGQFCGNAANQGRYPVPEL